MLVVLNIHPQSKTKLIETTKGNWFIKNNTTLLNDLQNETNLENFDDFIKFNKQFYNLNPGAVLILLI